MAISWGSSSLDAERYSTAPASLALSTSGGDSGWATAYYLRDLGRDYKGWKGLKGLGSGLKRAGRAGRKGWGQVSIFKINGIVVV